MQIKIPNLSLVVLMGASGSGKSTFARTFFKKTEIISSDECRALVSDEENNQSATTDAFDLLYFLAGKRLKNGLLTVIDATNVQKESRKGLIELAKTYHCLPVAIVLDLPEEVCAERNRGRSDRKLGAHVIRNQKQQLKKSLKDLKYEGFKQVYVLKSTDEISAVTEITRERLYNDKTEDTGPFDIIGDVHGCLTELIELLEKIGYQVRSTPPTNTDFGWEVTPPQGRRAIFLGDLVDRGPDSPGVLRLVMSMVNAGTALCVAGNHDAKLQKYLDGRQVQLKHGLETTVQQLEHQTQEFKAAASKFLFGLISHYVLDYGRLVVAHAGLREDMQGRGSAAVRSFCMYGETTGEIDEFGLPVRHNWAKEYRGKAKVIFGHTPVPEPEWLNKTLDIDTGCVFGGSLTALRYPEEDIVSVKAKKVYSEPVRPINYEAKETLSAQQADDDLLDIEDVLGKRVVQTRLRNNITISEESSIAALEVMSRFAVNPKWLIYLPPTMSPCATSALPNYLEHPLEALNYYRKNGIQKVVCEEKHMGSRAILIVCKDENAAERRFGVQGEGLGVCYTRTGRNFFNDPVLETAFLQRVSQCLAETGFWDRFSTEWVCLDAELMPWSAKAQSLIKDQYAAVGSAANAALPEVTEALRLATERGLPDAQRHLNRFSTKSNSIQKYVQAYRNYCWSVNSLDDYKLAPFHILATEGKVHIDQTHEWHMQTIADVCKGDPKLFMSTPYKIVDFDNSESFEDAINWWMELTKKGGEGMVVKPFDFVVSNNHGLMQPAVKCRGSEYLRIIYGPEYDSPENMERLKVRNISKKQSLALREFALGMEGLERFVEKEPLRRIHESIFGVLALESEDIDPRL